MQGEERIRRLRWLCRRGMKELDLLFESFIRDNDSQLQDGAFPAFERFLNEEDDHLWTWLQGNDGSDNPEYQALIRIIRRAE